MSEKGSTFGGEKSSGSQYLEGAEDFFDDSVSDSTHLCIFAFLLFVVLEQVIDSVQSLGSGFLAVLLWYLVVFWIEYLFLFVAVRSMNTLFGAILILYPIQILENLIAFVLFLRLPAFEYEYLALIFLINAYGLYWDTYGQQHVFLAHEHLVRMYESCCGNKEGSMDLLNEEPEPDLHFKEKMKIDTKITQEKTTHKSTVDLTRVGDGLSPGSFEDKNTYNDPLLLRSTAASQKSTQTIVPMDHVYSKNSNNTTNERTTSKNSTTKGPGSQAQAPPKTTEGGSYSLGGYNYPPKTTTEKDNYEGIHSINSSKIASTKNAPSPATTKKIPSSGPKSLQKVFL